MKEEEKKAIERLKEIATNTYAEGKARAIDTILNLIAKLQRENEELLQEKINNQKIIALAQNNMLNYQAGFEDGKNRRTSAVQSIIENQQYYIFQKQIEKYERHIEKLQKENEELKRLMAHKNGYTKLLEEDLFENCSNYVIPIQTIKDKIKELNKKEKQELKGTKGQDRYDIKQQYMYQRNILQELLEGRK